MPANVLTWNQAVRLGYQMNSFSHHPQGVPLGNVQAELCFKIWAQKIMGINCYFLEQASQKRFILTVYCTKRGYYLPGGDLDFAACQTGTSYSLQVGQDTKGKILVVKAIRCPK